MVYRLGWMSTLSLALFLTVAGRMLPAHSVEPPPGWHQDIPRGPVSIDGFPISGHIDAVSVADVVQAITAFKDIGLTNLVALTVINKYEIHGYIQNRDLGRFTAKPTVFVWPDRSRHPGWDAYGQGLPYFSEALRCIKAAQKVYIFPVTTPVEPHRDDKHLRLLDAGARGQLADLLGIEGDWFEGLNDLRYPDKEPTNVGFVFQNEKDELVLFLFYNTVSGTFNGENMGGTLNEKPYHELERWKKKYVQPELEYQETD